ncbi:hypothetical protein QCA50_003842 [Cerrena zonata]|uniref:Uncharacterized protein n=1 Tax=Cerrena zonata TaxID=2478898 RepID=A0AAW0GFB8_9APHY
MNVLYSLTFKSSPKTTHRQSASAQVSIPQPRVKISISRKYCASKKLDSELKLEKYGSSGHRRGTGPLSMFLSRFSLMVDIQGIFLSWSGLPVQKSQKSPNMTSAYRK